ncbi:MAG TPA: AAA family ATPase [Parafilimonas sp.]|nr:AAA family ATPase [Parafilimonas sp.]
MQTNILTLNQTPCSPFELASTSSKMAISQVFVQRRDSCLNAFALFLAHFNTIPNCINEIKVDCEKANKWFAETYKAAIKDSCFNKIYYGGCELGEFPDIFYFLYDDLLVHFDTHGATVTFLFRKTEIKLVEAIIMGIKKFRKRKDKRKPEVSVLVNTSKGIDTKSLEIAKPKLNIEDNYNDDFKDIHQTIFKRLSKKNDKGLVLLHGKPGTGKTSYIRYLISSLKKDVIFLPPNMASAITSPSLISILIENPNCIFVIEDAENIIVDRELNGGSPVSALLNIANGLLADCLNIQIICSFNTDISKIDSALLRKGRLIAKYEFKELAIEKAQRLSGKLGFNTDIHNPMTLASIYHQDEKDFQQTRKSNPVGF